MLTFSFTPLLVLVAVDNRLHLLSPNLTHLFEQRALGKVRYASVPLPQFTGVILLAVGVWGKVSLEAYLTLASEESTNAPYVLIGTGATIVIFGLFGCFATCRGSPWMLKLVGERSL